MEGEKKKLKREKSFIEKCLPVLCHEKEERSEELRALDLLAQKLEHIQDLLFHLLDLIEQEGFTESLEEEEEN